MFETIILIIFTMFIIIYKLLYKSHIITVEGFDKTPYLVNDLPDSQNAANVLARIMMIMNKLINNILKEYDIKQKLNTETEEDNKLSGDEEEEVGSKKRGLLQ